MLQCFYSETDYRKFVALLLEYFSARVHRTLIRVYISFASNETSINLVSFIILMHFITNKEKRVDKSTQHEGVDRGGGGTGMEGAESGVECAESGVEGAGSGSRGGGKRGNCGRGS